MSETRITLITGAKQGVGFQVAKELVANGVTVYLGSRNLERGEAAASEIGPGAIALQIDVTDGESIAAAAERIRSDHGRLDLLVNNAGISNARRSADAGEEQKAGIPACSQLSSRLGRRRHECRRQAELPAPPIQPAAGHGRPLLPVRLVPTGCRRPTAERSYAQWISQIG